MFGIGGFEFFLILIFGFLIFGPDKLPAIAQTIGKAIAKFRGAQEDMKEQLKNASFIDKDSDAPFNNPLEVLENVASSTKNNAQEVSEAANEAARDVADKTESFAERKARYDRERSERKRAEAEAAAAAGTQATEGGTDRKTAQSGTNSQDAEVSHQTAPQSSSSGADIDKEPKADVVRKSVTEEVD